jgi:hypothetical protein
MKPIAKGAHLAAPSFLPFAFQTGNVETSTNFGGNRVYQDLAPFSSRESLLLTVTGERSYPHASWFPKLPWLTVQPIIPVRVFNLTHHVAFGCLASSEKFSMLMTFPSCHAVQ